MDAGSQALPTGALIGKYEITQVLGIGGFGITYKAWDQRLQLNVAVKEYLPVEYAFRDAETTDVQPHSSSSIKAYNYGLHRFLEEARTLAKFKDPNIVRVVNHIEANGTAYLVMDYEEGETLAKRLKREGTLSETALLEIALPILNGLRTVHGVNILHRDIKPGNIYLRRNGSPVLIDFGSAKQGLGERTHAVTTMVTAGFAPFEQYSTRSKQGPYTDLYALGATMYRCINGNKALPQSSERVIEINDNGEDPLVSATKIGAGRYNRTLLGAIDWMLRVRPKDRPQTVDELIHKIAPNQVAVEENELSGPTRIIPGTSPFLDADISKEATVPTLEIEAIDLPSSHRVKLSPQASPNKIFNIGLAIVTFSAAVLGIGLWKNWIDLASLGLVADKTTAVVNTPPTISGDSNSSPIPASKPDRKSYPREGQTTRSTVSLHESSVEDADDAITIVAQESNDEAFHAVALIDPSSTPDDRPLNAPQGLLPESRIEGLAPAARPKQSAPREVSGDSPPSKNTPSDIKAESSAFTSDTTRDAVEVLAVAADAGMGQAPEKKPETSSLPTSRENGAEESAATLSGEQNTAVDQTSPQPAQPPEVIEDPTLVAERKHRAEIAALLEKGERFLRKGKLTRPENNNALATYRRLIELDPSNVRAVQALDEIGSRLQAIAAEKLTQQKYKTAERYIDIALTIREDHLSWLDLKKQIQTQRRDHDSRQERLNELFRQAKDLEAKDVTLDDKSDNLANIYIKVLELDSTNETAKTGLIDTLVRLRQLIQKSPSAEAFDRLTGYALTALELHPNDEAINGLYLDLQQDAETWQEEQTAPKITRMITTNEQPTGHTQSRDRFSTSTPRIYVAFDYQNFESGSILSALLFDGGQKFKLMQVPVVIKNTQGFHSFYLNKPVDGFRIGSYRVEMMLGEKHIAATDFIIDD